MKDDPFNRLFPPDLSVETVDILFEFLHHLTDSFHEIYADQIQSLMVRESFKPIEPWEPPEPPEEFDGSLDDDVPF